MPRGGDIIPIGMIRVEHSEALGALVKRERKNQGLTQAELAGLCGAGTRFVYDLERGKPSMHLGKTLDLLHTLGLHLHLSGLTEKDPA